MRLVVADTGPINYLVLIDAIGVITLARAISADLILMDDRAGVAVAQQHGLAVTGTLGVLELGARRGLVDLASALTRLKTTNFRYPPEIMDALLARWVANKQ